MLDRGATGAISPAMPDPAPTDWSRIDTWVFDLDNTLYPGTCGLFQEVRQRMGLFIAERFGVPLDRAREIQADYFRRHGTTLIGLMREDGIDPQDYLSFVHNIDLSALPDGTVLAQTIAALPGRRVIYTNASARHAGQVLDRLGCAELFDAVHDIVAADFQPKPEPDAFLRFLDAQDIAPERAVFVEDMARNLQPARAAGMTTVWLRNPAEHRIEPTSEDLAHVDHVIEDLEDWLGAIVRTLVSRPAPV